MLINAGLTDFDAADYAQAQAFFESALEYAWDDKQKNEAHSLAEEAVALVLDEIRHLYTLGEVRLALGDEEGSAEAYRTVLSLDPEDPNAHLEIGLYHERRGEV